MFRHSVRSFFALTITLCLASATAQTSTTPKTGTPVKVAAPSAVTSPTLSATAISVSKAIKGQIVSCPATLNPSAQAVCLYTKSSATTVRPLIRGTVGTVVVGDWKTAAQTSTLLIKEAGTNKLGGYIMLRPMSANEALVMVDNIPAKVKPPTKPTVVVPQGVVKGQPYLLGSDLTGLVTVTSLGAGKYRLSVGSEAPLTLTAGSKTAQRANGTIELPMLPVTDGKNLLFPLADLSALGCTVNKATVGVTIACGTDSLGVRPIVFQ